MYFSIKKTPFLTQPDTFFSVEGAEPDSQFGWYHPHHLHCSDHFNHFRSVYLEIKSKNLFINFPGLMNLL